MANIAIFRINYKSDFILTLESDAGWMTPFCIKFWTGAPSQAYFAGWDGTTYTNCAPVEGEPTKLLVQFDDHHLPIGDLKFQIGYHFTVADFPTSIEDEVINQAAVIIDNDGQQQQVMLDFNGETAPEIEFSLPAYANEAQRIANEAQRIANEDQRIATETQRIANEEQRISQEQTRQQNEVQRIIQEQARVTAERERFNDYAKLKADAIAATDAANSAADLANEKAQLAADNAQLAADKAAIAQSASALATEKAQLATDKAALAQSAATLANEKAALAQQKAEYATAQGDYAKAQGDYAKAQAGVIPTDVTLTQTDATFVNGNHDPLFYLRQANSSLAGLMTAAGYTKLNDMPSAQEVNAGLAYDVSVLHPTSGVNGGSTYASLSAALAVIPQDKRKGGMTVKFVLSSDNNYVQYRYMPSDASTAATFTNVANWQGVDVEPADYSQNLVESGGVKKQISVSNLAKNKMLAISGLGIRNWNPAVITTIASETLYYFPVTSGQLVYIEIEGSATRFHCAFTAQKPASGNSISDYNYAYAPMTNFTAPSNGFVCISGASITGAICYSKKNDIGSDVFDIQNELNGVLYNGFVFGNVLLFDKTQVYEGDTIVFKTDKTYSSGEVVFYDEDDTILLEFSFAKSSTQERMIPKGFDHCSTLYTPSFESLLIKKASMEERIRKNEVEQTPLRGLKIAYNGDSICESRTNQASNSYNGGAYAKLIADLVGGTYQNRGVSGGILASVAPDPSKTPTRTICTDVTNMADDADIVCFEGGINDYWLHVPLGDYQPNKYDETGGAFDTTTLCGALESIFYQATNKWVGKPIVFIIVHKVGSTAYIKNYTGGYTFQEAHDKMVEICEKWSIPVYDAFSKSGLNGNINAQNSEFFIINASTQTGDRTHPNIDGYKNYYVRQLVSLFSSILPTE